MGLQTKPKPKIGHFVNNIIQKATFMKIFFDDHFEMDGNSHNTKGSERHWLIVQVI